MNAYHFKVFLNDLLFGPVCVCGGWGGGGGGWRQREGSYVLLKNLLMMVCISTIINNLMYPWRGPHETKRETDRRTDRQTESVYPFLRDQGECESDGEVLRAQHFDRERTRTRTRKLYFPRIVV